VNKADNLRAWLTAKVPGLADNPDRLQIFTEHGAVRCTGTLSLSFAYHYKLVIAVTPHHGSLDRLTVPLLVWIAGNQPELLDAANNEPFTFESEILDAESSDVEITLDLVDRVRVTKRVDGGYVAERLPEIVANDSFDVNSLLRQIYHAAGDDIELIVQSMDPAWTGAGG
jgi:hypothetical protein